MRTTFYYREKILSLLGRKDIFDKFNINFKENQVIHYEKSYPLTNWVKDNYKIEEKYKNMIKRILEELKTTRKES